MPRRIRIPIVLLGLLAGLGACGDPGAAPEPDDALREEATRPGWTTSAALLEALAARVADGRGISDATWTRDVQEVGMALWPRDDAPEDLAARRDHTNLTHIAGDMAGRLAGDDVVREAWMARDPMSVQVHDAFVEAASAGVEAYRAWVVGAGRALLEERVRRLQGERPPR